MTLKAERGMSAYCDALATIFLILGKDRAIQLAEETDGIEAFFILTDGSFVSTDGMNVAE